MAVGQIKHGFVLLFSALEKQYGNRAVGLGNPRCETCNRVSLSRLGCVEAPAVTNTHSFLTQLELLVEQRGLRKALGNVSDLLTSF